MDEMFNKKCCDRCQGPLDARTISMMNMDVLCIKCKDEEQTHPKYKEACDMELQEVLKGNRNFEGMFAGKVYPFD